MKQSPSEAFSNREFLRFYGKPQIHYPVHRVPQCVPVSSHINLFHTKLSNVYQVSLSRAQSGQGLILITHHFLAPELEYGQSYTDISSSPLCSPVYLTSTIPQ
jgi:hypothetical protein